MKPQRMCTVCRAMKDKCELIRVVKYKGKVFFDDEGRALGRGAYICRNGECIPKARKCRAFERSLSTGISSEFYDALEGRTENE